MMSPSAAKFRRATARILPLALALSLWCAHPSPMYAITAPQSADAGASSTPETKLGEDQKQAPDENDEYKHSASVTALGSRLGLSPDHAAMAFEVTNFVILAVLIGLFLARSLPKAFRRRTTTIQRHLGEARIATEEASARIKGVEDRLGKLDQQIASMRSQAERDWATEEQRLKALVTDEREKILAAADQEIATAVSQARKRIQQFAADLAIDQAAKRLVVSAETDRLLVQSFARRLTGDDERGGQN